VDRVFALALAGLACRWPLSPLRCRTGWPSAVLAAQALAGPAGRWPVCCRCRRFAAGLASCQLSQGDLWPCRCAGWLAPNFREHKPAQRVAALPQRAKI
jgi:hypothetical protein